MEELLEYLQEDADGDILLSWKSTSGKHGHFREETLWLPAEHRVVRRTTGSVRRLWGLLPPKAIESKPEDLLLPEDVNTEEQVLAYLAKHKRSWLNHRHHG